jgi:2-iminobutanoate/2-iminopropanoate deaminase
MKPPHLAPFTKAGSLVFLSGQLPFDDTGKIVGSGVAEQTAQVLKNIEATLSRLGLDCRDVVKTTIWLRPGTSFLEFNDEYAAFFGEHRPARSTIYSDLALPSAVVEIEAIAVQP